METFKKGWVVLFCMLFAFLAQSQNSEIKFSHLTQKDGLASKELFSIIKDSKGNLWIGSSGGLNRFDGTHFYTFRKNREGSSVLNNTVIDICEDHQGNIWGATASGIFKYHPSSNKFTNYSTVFVGEGPGVENILCTANGEIYAGGIPGLLKYDAEADSFSRVNAGNLSSNNLTIDRIRKNCMLADGNGIWIATRNGLNFYDINRKIFLNHLNQKSSFLFNDHSVRALAKSPAGHLWMFDNNISSVVGFKPGSDSSLYSIKLDKILHDPFGATLFEDRQNRLWFCSLGHEMVVIDYLNGNKIQQVQYESGNPLSISSTFFWDAIEDKDGTTWLATISGISKCNSSRDFLRYHFLSKKIPELKEEYAVAYLTENPLDLTWWILIFQGMVLQYDPKTGSTLLLDLTNADRNRMGELPGRVNRISFINEDVIVSCYNGSWKWNKSDNKFRPANLLPSPFQDFAVADMVKGLDNSLWVTDFRSVIHYDPATSRIKQFLAPTEMQQTTNLALLSKLRMGPDGKLWMMKTIGGFAWVNDSCEKIVTVPFNLPAEKTRIAFFNDFQVDRAGNIWFAYEGQGLYYYQVKERRFRWWDESDDLSSANISSAMVDSHWQVWSMDRNYLNILVPATNSIYKYELPEQPNSDPYSIFSARLKNGNIITNVMGDILEINPANVIGKPADPKIILSEVEISGRKNSLGNKKLLELAPSDNYLKFRFGTLTDKAWFPYTIFYKLEGIDEAWQVAGNSNEAVYTHLPPGKFTFRVMVAGENNAWRSPEEALTIIIHRPFYKTAWFIISVILIVAGLLYSWYRERLKNQAVLYQVEGKAQILAKEKTQVQYENLKQHLNPHFLFNSLSSLSSLIEIDPKLAGVFLNSLSKTYRYILQSKDKETVSLKEEIAFVKTFVALQQTRFEQGLEVYFEINEAEYHRRIVPVTLQNLVENAIKHNIIDDENKLVISFQTDEGYLVVKNKMQLKKFVETSNKQGLDNLRSLYLYLTDKPFIYGKEGEYFIVKIPLL